MMNGRQKMLATESIGRLLVRLSVPAGIGMFVMALYNVVDTIFIGRVVGPLGIAGLTIVFPVQMIVMGLGMIVGIGGSSIISRAIGANDIQRAERTLGNSVLAILVLGVLVPIIVLPNIDFWLRLFGASDAVLPYSRAYMGIIVIGTFFQVFAMGVSQLVRAEGNARVPMLSMIIGAGLNIVLDAVFVLGLNMGISGAALATVISQTVSTVYVIVYYLFGNSTLNIHPTSFKPEGSVIREMFTVGIGSFFRTTGGSLVMIFVNRLLSTYGGDLAIASLGMMMRVMMFLFMPLMSVAQGLQPVLGFAYGAKQFHRAIQSIKLAAIAGEVLSIISFILVFFLAGSIFRVFTQDQALIESATHAARIVFLAAATIGVQMVGSVVFQALGKPVQTFITATSRQVLFVLPLVFILPKFLGINGIWASFAIADALSAFMTVGLLIPELRAMRRAGSTQAPHIPLPLEQAQGETP